MSAEGCRGEAVVRGIELGADALRRPHRLLPDRGAARACQAVADRQGETAAMAVPALGRLGIWGYTGHTAIWNS